MGTATSVLPTSASLAGIRTRPAPREALGHQSEFGHCELLISSEIIWKDGALGFSVIGVKIKSQGGLLASLTVLS